MMSHFARTTRSLAISVTTCAATVAHSAVLIAVMLMILFAQQAWAQMNAEQAWEAFQQQADNAYASGKYHNAFIMYQRLATVGDKFAQYRLAIMHAQGQSVSKDATAAYAWAKLAAANGQPEFVRLQQEIQAGLGADQLILAEHQAEQLQSRYGVFANASAARKMLDHERRRCTGSRTGSRCDAVSAFSSSCSSNLEEWPSELCLRIGSLGLLSVAGSFPASLRRLEMALDIVIEQYHPGNVELRELELLVDELNSSGAMQK